VASVVEQIQQLGIEVQHIPGGCTGLRQPLDIGYNKPLKNQIKVLWEAWMLSEEMLMTRMAPPSQQQLIAEWVHTATQMMPERMMRNA
jgi:hypothetical protein